MKSKFLSDNSIITSNTYFVYLFVVKLVCLDHLEDAFLLLSMQFNILIKYWYCLTSYNKLLDELYELNNKQFKYL